MLAHNHTSIWQGTALANGLVSPRPFPVKVWNWRIFTGWKNETPIAIRFPSPQTNVLITQGRSCSPFGLIIFFFPSNTIAGEINVSYHYGTVYEMLTVVLSWEERDVSLSYFKLKRGHRNKLSTSWVIDATNAPLNIKRRGREKHHCKHFFLEFE